MENKVGKMYRLTNEPNSRKYLERNINALFLIISYDGESKLLG